jgi:hypothetical protein
MYDNSQRPNRTYDNFRGPYRRNPYIFVCVIVLIVARLFFFGNHSHSFTAQEPFFVQLPSDSNIHGSLTLAARNSAMGESGGSGYCNYQTTMILQSLTLTNVAGHLIPSRLHARMIERAPGCSFGTLAPEDQTFTAVSGSANTGIDMKFMQHNPSRAYALLHLTPSAGGTYTGSIIFQRYDSAPVLNWTIPVPIRMNPQ